MPTTLQRERGGRVARVSYDNADRGNCFDLPLLAELVDTLESADADKTCRLILLDMAGQHFCGGWDTTSFAGLADAGEDEVAASLRESDELLDRIRRLPVPVVAAVRGQVVGFGVGLLSTVHLPVAATDVRASLPEVRYGFAPGGVGYTVARALPRAHAYSFLTGTPATGAQLLAWGLVSSVVADSRLDEAVDELVGSLVDLPDGALRGVVEVVESSRGTGSPEQAYRASARTIVRALDERGSR